MNLAGTQIKDTYGNLITIGSVAGTPTTGTLQNGAGSDITSLTLNGAAVFNEGGGNFDFRVEGDTDANLLFVDASTDRVGIGTSSPTNLLTVAGNANITGNTTLGDASTDTVRVNGVMGIGTPPVSYRSLQIASSGLTGNINVLAVDINSSIASDVTNTFSALRTLPATAAASFTVGQVTGVSVANASKGAGSTISTLVGIEIADQTQGNANRGLVSAVSSGANKWNIYASGTADNYFAGDVGIGTTSPIKELDVSGEIRASTGILFGSDTAAANTLDDYEEGTWTPVFEPATGSFATMTMDIITAVYTKIGRQVTVYANIRTDNVDSTGASGDLRIGGLPFASSSSAGLSAGSVSRALSWSASEFPISAYVVGGTSYMLLSKRSAVDGADTTLQVGALTTGATFNQNGILFSATYFV